MLAITMEHAVTKPTVRRGGGDFTERRSAMVVIVGLTVAFKLMIGERSDLLVDEWKLVVGLEKSQNHISDFPELSEAIPGVSLKAA
jgi:hypothetical protein